MTYLLDANVLIEGSRFYGSCDASVGGFRAADDEHAVPA